MQRQIIVLFDRALSLDSDRKKSVSEKMVAWSEKAREKKTECKEGKISLEEFRQWLKEP